ncbi:hypothetical protein GJV26_01820 [Massilia dura]|uniref:Uncharacterized protein n=1 Tax=Pseudoduganella dura TaxID=321982 RepID=A0A6I3XHK7_9BURK|nr:hypothetical protein [Pseudoduganella dura]MUI11235.1 hypothetical protein [Pseudoduganella dura]GGX93851.1 hypothetical protein GCM10007386_25930 [Pseudoduganella dura]
MKAMERIDTLENLEKFLEVDLGWYALKPRIDHPGIRISDTCDNIARYIKKGDRDAARVGYQIIARDPHLPFGKLIKSGIARALRQHIDLMSPMERAGFTKKTSDLLNLPFCPRETEDYCKVVRKLGPEAMRFVVENTHAKNEKSMRLLVYLSQSSTLWEGM